MSAEANMEQVLSNLFNMCGNKWNIYKKGNEPATDLSGWQVRNLLPFYRAAVRATALLQRAARGAQPPLTASNITTRAIFIFSSVPTLFLVILLPGFRVVLRLLTLLTCKDNRNICQCILVLQEIILSHHNFQPTFFFCIHTIQKPNSNISQSFSSKHIQ